MELPGGIMVGGMLRRDFAFHPVCGHLELALTEGAQQAAPTPDRVTQVLCQALASLAAAPPDLERVAQLSVGDRQFLMRQLALHLGQDGLWLTAACTDCGEPFDFHLLQSALPVKAAGVGYPACTVSLAGRPFAVRAPTGDDQSAVVGLEPHAQHQALWCRLVTAPPGVDVAAVSEDERAALEQAIEALSPEVAEVVATRCPTCGGANHVTVDPYWVLGRVGAELFAEIHRIAIWYHWSEGVILDLPRSRRRLYLHLIDRQRGLASPAPEESVPV